MGGHAPPESMSQTSTKPIVKAGTPGKVVVLVGIAIIGLVAIPFLLAGRGAERYVDLRSLQQLELSSMRVGSFHLTPLEVREIDRWPMEDVHAHVVRAGLGTPLRETPSAYWEEMGFDEAERPPLWHATYRLLPMAVIVKIENRRPMTPEARTQLDLRVMMASILDPADAEDRALYRHLDSKLSKGVRVFDPMNPPRGRVGYVPPVEGEQFARQLLSRILDAVHADPENATLRTREILASAASEGAGA